jgi:peptidoglycan hydrolase CwlO-like protein
MDLSVILTAIAGLITTSGTFMFNKSKYKADVRSVEESTNNTMMQTYTKAFETYKSQIEYMNGRINELQGFLIELQCKFDALQEEYRRTQNEYRQYKMDAMSRERDYLMKKKADDEKINKLDTRIAQLHLKVCIVPECRKRIRPDDRKEEENNSTKTNKR